MTTESRGKKKYYYRSRRVGGRVVKEYVGTGEEHDADAARHAAEQERRKEFERINVMLDVLDEVCEIAIEQQMEAAGYHRTNGGPWRKRRKPKAAGLAAAPPGVGQSPSTPAEPARSE